MADKFQVSIIVVSYNPVFEKLRLTLLRAIEQKNVCFEVIVCDDGSKDDYFDRIKQIFLSCHFLNYKLVKHKHNVGTVKNFLSGLDIAEGTYIAATSPGDYFYDDTTMRDLYEFAVLRNIKVCFGNAVYYIPGIKPQLLKDKFNDPIHMRVFDYMSAEEQKIAYFFFGHALGATIFRERKSAIYYLEQIKDWSKLAEEGGIIAMLLAGEKLYHLNRYTLWYEYGLGMSTSTESPYKEQLKQDIDSVYYQLSVLYSHDSALKVKMQYWGKYNKYVLAFILLFRYPRVLFKIMQQRYMEKTVVNLWPVDMSKFPKFDKE